LKNEAVLTGYGYSTEGKNTANSRKHDYSGIIFADSVNAL